MRWLTRFIRTVIGMVVAVLLMLCICTVLLMFWQDGRFFVAAVLWQIVGHHHPPPIAAGLISTGSDWINPEPTNAKFTAALRQRFPLGSDAGAMRDALQAQGFGGEVDLHEKAPCTPPDAEPSPTLRLLHCPPVPWQHSFHYTWGGAVCHQDLTVFWSADARNRIAQIVGSYGATCL